MVAFKIIDECNKTAVKINSHIFKIHFWNCVAFSQRHYLLRLIYGAVFPFFPVNKLKTGCDSWEDYHQIMKITGLCFVVVLHIVIRWTESSFVHLQVDVNHTIADLSHFWESTGFWWVRYNVLFTEEKECSKYFTKSFWNLFLCSMIKNRSLVQFTWFLILTAHHSPTRILLHGS